MPDVLEAAVGPPPEALKQQPWNRRLIYAPTGSGIAVAVGVVGDGLGAGHQHRVAFAEGGGGVLGEPVEGRV